MDNEQQRKRVAELEQRTEVPKSKVADLKAVAASLEAKLREAEGVVARERLQSDGLRAESAKLKKVSTLPRLADSAHVAHRLLVAARRTPSAWPVRT